MGYSAYTSYGDPIRRWVPGDDDDDLQCDSCGDRITEGDHRTFRRHCQPCHDRIWCRCGSIKERDYETMCWHCQDNGKDAR